jgi:tetratricopeptide (TPR) repeat protein
MLLLARGYQELGRTAEAILELRRAHGIYPQVQSLREALRRVEQHEQQEFDTFVGQQEQSLHGSTNTLTFEQYIEGKADEGESTVSFLQQQAAKKEDVEGGRTGVELPQDAPPRIVTPTLAEIYASQGEYREAINAYRALMERRPDEAGRFQKRIQELEALAAIEKPLG